MEYAACFIVGWMLRPFGDVILKIIQNARSIANERKP
jgi:hypothetical protein